MNIGELAKRTGMATSKIRFYEAAGLLGVVERKENGFRTYSEHSLVTLAFIQDAQKAGLDLEAIRALLPQHTAIPKAERALKTLLRQLQSKLAATDLLQQRLRQQRHELVCTIAQVQSRVNQGSNAAPPQQSLL
jgi:DNA-binding transcriptional MerR regulator